MYWFEYDAAAEREAIRESAHKAGLKEGLKEGLKSGLKEGRKKGRQEGRLEGSQEKAIDMIKKLFKENIPIEIIKKVTGQTEEQILAIVNDKA